MKLAAVAAAVVALASPGLAEAVCGTPSWLGTGTGTAIPPKGSLYIYSESLQDKQPGGPIVGYTRISETVAKIDYATRADELELKIDDWSEPTVLNVDKAWRAPAAAPRAIHIWHHAYAWTCSSANSLMVQIDQPAAAYRVRWHFAGKPAQEWILPAQSEGDGVHVLELGKINCGGTTIDPDELAQGGRLSLVAIRFDGSEVAVRGLPLELSTRDVPTTSNGLDHAMHVIDDVAPAQAFEQDPDFALHLFAIVLAIGGVLLVVRFRHRALKEVV